VEAFSNLSKRTSADCGRDLVPFLYMALVLADEGSASLGAVLARGAALAILFVVFLRDGGLGCSFFFLVHA